MLALLSARIAISSATASADMFCFPRLYPLLLLSRVHSRGAMNKTNRVGDIISPCFVPLRKLIGSVQPSAVSILVIPFLRVSKIASPSLPILIWSRISLSTQCSTESKALAKSM